MGEIDAAWLTLLFGLTGVGALVGFILRLIRNSRGGLR